MNCLDKEEHKKTFDRWAQRMHLCMDNDGDYFEHLMIYSKVQKSLPCI